MLVEGAIRRLGSAIYLRTSVLTGPGLAVLDMRVLRALWWEVALTGDDSLGSLDAATRMLRGSSCRAGLVRVLLFGNAGWAFGGILRALRQVCPRLFPYVCRLAGTMKAVQRRS